MVRPYVGITGLTTTEEIDFVNDEFRNSEFDIRSTHDPMAGFLVSNRTLYGEEIKNPLHVMTHPRFQNLESLLQYARNKGLFTTIHYHTASHVNLSKEIEKLMRRFHYRGLCDTIQLNIVWPDIKELSKIKFPLNIIFQANEKSMNGLTPKQYSQKLKEYESKIEYVLLDLSGGKGIEIDVQKLAPYYEEITAKLPNIKIVFTGGLSGSNLEKKAKELATIVGINTYSIDSEGKLRTDDNTRLDESRCREYIKAARRVFQP
jgi:hypothetical protein